MRDQEFLLPPNMADWLPEDHLVWFVIEVVEQLDTEAFHKNRRLGRQGRRAYDPDMLLVLLLFAYAVGERSSRRIERLCVDHVAFRVLCGQDPPDHTTIARFRADHQEAFKSLFAQVLRLCADAGMVKVGTVSIDGTKIAANAARSANRAPDWVREQAARLAEEVVADADATDAAEDAAAGRGGDDDDELPPGFATHKGRAANIAKALEELDRRDAGHAEADAADRERVEQFLADVESSAAPGPAPAGVDPMRHQQARIRRMLVELAEQEQIRGTAASQRRAQLRRQLRQAEQSLTQARELAAAGEVDLRGKARRLRERRAAKARARGGLGDAVNLTDPDSRLMTDGSGGGSVQGYNAQIAVTDDHLILGVHLSQDSNDTHCFTPTSEQATAHAETLGKDIDLLLADAGYFTDGNLTTTGPDRLIAPGKNRDVHAAARDEPATGSPAEDATPKEATPKEAMRHRLRDPVNAERYKRRSATVEPVIGHLKDKTRLRRFAQRGIQAATAELNLAATVTNLSRLHQLRTATG